MALIQLERGAADGQDQAALHDESVIDDYRRQAQATLELMLRKNHDYDEAWRLMRVTSMTDLILMKGCSAPKKSNRTTARPWSAKA